METGQSIHNGIQDANIRACSQQSFVSMDVVQNIAIKFGILKLEKVQQELCYALSAMKEKCVQYKGESTKAIIDVECAFPTSDNSASLDSRFNSSYDTRSKRLTGGKALLLKVSGRDICHSSIPYFIHFLNSITLPPHDVSTNAWCASWSRFQSEILWKLNESGS